MKQVLALLFIIFCVTCNAQDFQLGFRLEGNILKIRSETSRSTPNFTPGTFQLNGSYFLSEILAIEARTGIELVTEDYQGFEYGLMTKYFITSKAEKVYLLGGVMFHHNFSNAHGTYTLYEKTFTLPSVGIGVNPRGLLNVEMLFQYGMNQVMAGSWELLYPNSVLHTSKLEWVIKIGAGLSWSL